MKRVLLNIFVAIALANITLAQEKVHEEDILIMNDSIQLPGTLSLNPQLESQPLAIFIQGSGNPDRNGNQPLMNVKANYIKQLAHALYENGIAMFRFDKRNVTVANHKYIIENYVFEDLVSDAISVIRYFEKDSRFSKTNLIGHSQGSLVGMLAVNEAVSKYVSLAGLGFPADETIIRQVSAQNKELAEAAEQHFNELRENDSIARIHPYLFSIFAPANHTFLLSYIKYDPEEEIKRLNIPVLILNGDLDSQVLEADAEELLKGQPGARLEIISGMNHVLKHLESEQDNVKSYYSDAYPISTELVKILTEFIKD